MSRSEAGRWFSAFGTEFGEDINGPAKKIKFEWASLDREQIIDFMISGAAYLVDWTEADKVHLFDELMK